MCVLINFILFFFFICVFFENLEIVIFSSNLILMESLRCVGLGLNDILNGINFVEGIRIVLLKVVLFIIMED